MSKWICGLAIAGLVSCAVDDADLGSTAGITFEEFAARTAREPATDAYVVDGDIVVRGDDELRAFYDQFQQGGLAIYSAGGTDVRWSASQRTQLTYCVSDRFGSRKQAVIDALAAAHDAGWETFADVDFTHVPAHDASCTGQNASVMFDVNPTSGAPYLARAFFPNEARAYRNVLIDDSAFERIGAGALTGLLAHELGHVLGFRHEHIRPEAANTDEDCVEDEQFRGVTPYDSASVMHYPSCHGTGTTLAFTAADREGAALVYGPPGGAPGVLAAPAPAPEAGEPVVDAENEPSGGGCSTGGGGGPVALLVIAFALGIARSGPRRSASSS